MVLPTVNTQAMALHLAETGWHKTGGALAVPENITLLPLPPDAPQLNPVENIWQYLRQNDLCHTVWESYDIIVEASCAHGESLSPCLSASDQSRQDSGQKSLFKAVDITHRRL